MLQRDEAIRYAVDERLVVPESRFEVVDGQVLYVRPAGPEHASCHARLAALLEACCAEGYDVAVDMLTRTSETSDMAPDASVYPIAPDPETGRRQLEELAFEVVSTETIGHAQKKARALRERGVRRVFAIDVERRRVLELSDATGSFEILDSSSAIVDLVLAAPLEVGALVDVAKIDDALGKALLRKKNIAIEAALREREAIGQAKGEAIGQAKGEAIGQAKGEAIGQAKGEAIGQAKGEAIGQAKGEAIGQAKGEAIGQAKGEAIGRAEGAAMGRLQAKREALVVFLRSRGLALSAPAQARLDSTDDETVLDRWLLEAGRCLTADELLGL